MLLLLLLLLLLPLLPLLPLSSPMTETKTVGPRMDPWRTPYLIGVVPLHQLRAARQVRPEPLNLGVPDSHGGQLAEQLVGVDGVEGRGEVERRDRQRLSPLSGSGSLPMGCCHSRYC